MEIEQVVEKIDAYKCSITSAVFEDQSRAVKAEFRAMMRRAGGSLPAWGSIDPMKIMDWLASEIESGVYPTAIIKIQEALEYWQANRLPPS